MTNCKIGPPPGLTAADRPLAAGADGYHFHDTQGCVLFENNEIALTDDDPISIKDGVWRDIKAAGPDRLSCMEPVPAMNSFSIAGISVRSIFMPRLLRSDWGDCPVGSEPACEPAREFHWPGRLHPNDNWIIKDSYLHDYYGRLLLCAPHGLITGNEIHDSYAHLGANDATFDSAGHSFPGLRVNNLFVNTECGHRHLGVGFDLFRLSRCRFCRQQFYRPRPNPGQRWSAVGM